LLDKLKMPSRQELTPKTEASLPLPLDGILPSLTVSTLLMEPPLTSVMLPRLLEMSLMPHSLAK